MLDLRLASHGRFQIAVLALVLAGGGWGLAALTTRLPGAALVLAEAVLAFALAFTAQAQGRSRSRRALLAGPALLACALADACFLPWAGTSPVATLVVGPLYGLVTSLGLIPAHLVRPVSDRIDLAMAALAEDAGSATHALAERARISFRRLAAGLRRSPGAESLRLLQLAEAGTLQACALALRCRELRSEIAAMGRDVLDERRTRLATRLDATNDPEARRSLRAAFVETREMGDRVGALATASERIEARLELQVILLEGTALAVALRRATEEAGAAAMLAPLAERLRDAGIEMQAEAQALTDLGV